MKKIFRNIGLMFGLLSIMMACSDDIDPVITELETDRAFAPVDLRAFIRNQTTIELNWETKEGVDEYVVEFSQDSLQFNSIIRTVTVLPDGLPLRETFKGETRYSARVKSVAEGRADSKWNTITIMTDIENILEPFQDGDVAATSVTFRWPAGSDVTHFVIKPGDVQRDITADEKAAGEAIIDGLSGETEYQITLYNNAERRGVATFETLVDIGDATPVYPEDDLLAMIAAANDGDVLALFPGEYGAADAGLTIELDKSITIRGVYPYDKPLVHANFDLKAGATDVEIRDLELTGDNSESTVFDIIDEGVAFGSFTVSGCFIRDYTRQLIYGNIASTIESVTFDNCIVQNFVTSGGDFIDFRKTYAAEINILNSTFINCAQGRDFIRYDALSGYSGTGLTAEISIDHCTIYACATSGKRIFYVRFDTNVLSAKNTLFAETDGIYSNQVSTSIPSFSNNYYNNAGTLMTDGSISDTDGDAVADPGFEDAPNGNFTLSNQNLIDNQVGDPRWRP